MNLVERRDVFENSKCIDEKQNLSESRKLIPNTYHPLLIEKFDSKPKTLNFENQIAALALKMFGKQTLTSERK